MRLVVDWIECLIRQNPKPKQKKAPVSRALISVYSGLIAEVGQTSAQLPQSIHSLPSITYMLSPSEIQFTGHSDSQAPHEIHSSFITYAIVSTSIIYFGMYINPHIPMIYSIILNYNALCVKVL